MAREECCGGGICATTESDSNLKSHELEQLALQQLDVPRHHINWYQAAATKAIAYALLALLRFLRETEVSNE